MQFKPSVKNGFARNESQSKRPSLWKGLLNAWVPMLGVSGLIVRDYGALKDDGNFNNMDATNWVMTEDGYTIKFDGPSSNTFINGMNGSNYQSLTTGSILMRVKTEHSPTTGGHCIGVETNSSNNRQFSIVYSGVTNKFQITGVDSSNVFKFTIRTADTVPDNEYYTICYQTFAGSSVSDFWLNGELQTMTLVSGTLTNFFLGDAMLSGDSVQLGAKSDGGSPQTPNFWNGNIDIALVYNRMLSQNEIKDFHDNPIQMFEPKRNISPISFVATTPSANSGAAMYHHLQTLGAY